MKAAAKARVMLGRDLNNDAVRAAALRCRDLLVVMKKEQQLKRRIAEEILKGVGGQESSSLK